MIVVNEADWVWWSLKSVYDSVDHIVIVEGVSKDTWMEFDLFTPDGLSTDGTQEEIKRFIEQEDPDHKIEYAQVGFQDTIGALRDIALHLCPSDSDYILVVDADHLYDESQLRHVKFLCEKYPNIRTVFAEQLIFFQDMHHILTIGQEYLRPYGHHLSCFFYRYNPELRYKSEIPFFDHQLEPDGWLHPQQEVSLTTLPKSSDDVAVYPPQFQFWHFGWMGRRESFERHLLGTTWRRILRIKWLQEHDPEKAKEIEGSYWMQFVGMTAEEILDYHHLYHKIWTGLYDDKVDEKLIPYTGIYPLDGLIQTHPFWGKSRHWFGLKDSL